MNVERDTNSSVTQCAVITRLSNTHFRSVCVCACGRSCRKTEIKDGRKNPLGLSNMEEPELISGSVFTVYERVHLRSRK